MEVEILDEALDELDVLPLAERQAMMNAIEKLEVVGIGLGAPHSSQVKGFSIRELRPRQGRSPWRAFYRRTGNVIVVGAIGPEASKDPKKFERAARLAEKRIASFGSIDPGAAERDDG